jgi:hypothetical protein
VHSIATDSKGNIFTTETYEGRRLQKFVYKGIARCRVTRECVAEEVKRFWTVAAMLLVVVAAVPIERRRKRKRKRRSRTTHDGIYTRAGERGEECISARA